jgi:predicted RNA-binding Zn ribbon-like protein
MPSSFDTRWHGVGTGGSLALDFVNTLDWRLRKTPVELLHSFQDLMRWSWSASVLDRAAAAALVSWGEAHPRVAARVLAEAIETREAIAAVFQAIVHREPVPPAALARLERTCRVAYASRVLRPAGTGVRWGWRAGDPEPERAVWAVVLDALRVLGSAEVERVRQCADAQCGWMFLDTSRNRSRRWCSMEGCGNRNKARGFYRRAQRERARKRGAGRQRK